MPASVHDITPPAKASIEELRALVDMLIDEFDNLKDRVTEIEEHGTRKRSYSQRSLSRSAIACLKTMAAHADLALPVTIWRETGGNQFAETVFKTLLDRHFIEVTAKHRYRITSAGLDYVKGLPA